MLELKGINMHYETQVLKDINFTSNPGDINVFIGPSGSGKTSLLNILAGNIKKYAGEANLGGRPIDHRSMAIGLVAQDYGLLPWKTVQGNIHLPIRIRKMKPSDHREKIDCIMEQLRIADLKNRFPSQLSGGQKQRVALAKTFVLDLDLLLMDEPFSALDSISREQAQQLFLDIWAASRPITMFVTHSIDEAVFLGNRISIISPMPGTIVKTIANPIFGTDDKRKSPIFHETTTKIRETLARGAASADQV